ncbi:MAG: excinuclease ABC subunit UvrB [Kiritimatiellae bacterium]|nr:excinuclease ABC subunit UvrB [Kiritimatiellia bacterium]
MTGAPRCDFPLSAPYEPTGDQPEAIEAIASAFDRGERFVSLEGVTGSGKTFTMANVIQRFGRPTLVVSHNKTLAAQLYGELKEFFPESAVRYFVSYYDYYQPEAYIPQTDTYIAKDASTNKDIERLRLAATDALCARDDVIVVSTVSCIYGLGSPEDYRSLLLTLRAGEERPRDGILRALVAVQYERNDVACTSGTFRVRGDTLDIFPAYREDGVRISFFGDFIESIRVFDPVTGRTTGEEDAIVISPAKHFVMAAEKMPAALERIKTELEECVAAFEREGKLLEAQRLRLRTNYDLEMLRELGYCSGIENYSRPLSGRAAGERPATLIDFFPPGFLTILDESHVTLPQVRGMFNGDQARKKTLVAHGFRLPSALDNRPMSYAEFMRATGPMLFVSATPGPAELALSGPPVRQIIRPTGILDPAIEVRPLAGQVDDLIGELRAVAERGERALVTTLTKRTAEELSAYLQEIGLKSKYLHSDITALDRVEILRGLRKADFDVLIGINLLREGLDLPEVALVAVLDADKEGFLRSTSSLVQTAGRAARNLHGRVILYADEITDSIAETVRLTRERRAAQEAYNEAHGITPKQIEKAIRDDMLLQRDAEEKVRKLDRAGAAEGADDDTAEVIAEMEREMAEAAAALEFERAAILRDQIYELKHEKNAIKAAAQERPVHPSRRKGDTAPFRRGKGARGGGLPRKKRG